MFKSLNNLPFDRITRVEQVLNSILPVRPWTIEDSKNLQHDPLTLRGAFEVELFKGWTSKTPEVERARATVAAWDAKLQKESAGAALYTAWRANADARALDATRARAERLPLVEPGLVKAIEQLTKQQGPDPSKWRYGPMHRRTFPHPFVQAFDLPTIERNGGAGAVAADGATYREILDVADWDRSVVTNVPGQSGQPESPFYGNLLALYERGEYFPLVYSKNRINAESAHKLVLRPR